MTTQLTPEQWRALDEAQKYVEAQLALPPTKRDYQALQRAYWRRDGYMQAHARALIDAARPKCGRCGGTGNDPRYHLNQRPCPDCGGTGWAA